MATITTETVATTIDIAQSSEDYSVENLDGELQPLMMAQAVPNPPNDKKRVKVYELKNNDWFDRGTGFCVASFIFVRLAFIYMPLACALATTRSCLAVDTVLTPIPQNEVTRQEEPRVLVQSEDEPDKILLETRICKEDSFQKQQGTEDWQALFKGLC